MAAADLGLRAGLHQHTGTVIEKHDEVYGIMESVNTKYMNFAPDVGQLQKGGSDASQVVKDFAKITTHMHLKDYSNGKYMAGYCPPGDGNGGYTIHTEYTRNSWQSPRRDTRTGPRKRAHDGA